MNSRVMILLAVLLILGASIAGYLGYKTTQEAQQAALVEQQKAIEAQKKAAEVVVEGKVPVVIAKQEIPAYKKLTAEDLTLDYLKVAPPNTYRKIEDVLDQPVQVPLAPGALLQLSDLQPGSEVARLLKPGERAIAIPVDEVVGGGGFVQPGDLVDVLLFLRGENGAKDSAQVVMQALRVVGFGSQIISQDGGPETSDQKEGRKADRARARTAVLAVSEKDVTRVLLASSLGTLRLTIRPPEEPLAVADASSPDAVGKAPVGKKEQPVAGSNAVPTQAQRQLLTSSILQPAVARPAVASRPAGAKSAPAPQQPSVIIYRGLEAQKVSP